MIASVHPLLDFALFTVSCSLMDAAIIQSCNREGMFTISYANGSWECAPCMLCPPGAKISEPCRYDRNTECKACPQETFVSESGMECKPCTQCEPGNFVQEQCSGNKDRICIPCTDGFFSITSNALSCRRCGVCKLNELILRKCNKQNNILCGDCDKNHYRESSSLTCFPCSQCHGKTSVKVPECVRKNGEQSSKVCQPQHIVVTWKGNSTESAIVPRVTLSVDSTRDALTVTLPIVLSMSVFILTLACLQVIFLRMVICKNKLLNRLSNVTRSGLNTFIKNEKVEAEPTAKHIGGDSYTNDFVQMDELHMETLLTKDGNGEEVNIEMHSLTDKLSDHMRENR